MTLLKNRSPTKKLGGALLAAPKAFGVRDASGRRKRLPSRANPARPGFSAESEFRTPGSFFASSVYPRSTSL